MIETATNVRFWALGREVAVTADRQRNRQLGAAVAVFAFVVASMAVLSPARALTNCNVSAADLAVDTEERQMLALINDYRAANRLRPLTHDPGLARAAAWFARDMATNNYWASTHVDRLRRNIPTRLTECDVVYRGWGENLAAGKESAEETFQQWVDSPTHNAIMLDPNMTHAGIARAFDPNSTYGWYWVLNVGSGITTTTTTSTSTTSTSTTSTSRPSTTTSSTSTSTTSTSTPTSTTSSTSTSTTTSSTTTSTSTTSTLPTSTTTTSTPASTTTTTVAPPASGLCGQLEALTNQTSAQIAAVAQALSTSLRGAQLQAVLAQLEQVRATTTAQIDAARVRAGCAATLDVLTAATAS